MDYQHWQLRTDDHQILWLTFDRANKSANTLSRDVFDELETIITQIEADQPAGVVLCSGKDKGFIAGADIAQFTHLSTEDAAFDLIRQAQIIFDRWEALPMPTVAMIDGFCLGGGTEFVLACRYRIASEDAATKIGLPEVKLGIHPGWGGTVRLPRLIGAPKAMSVMLTGRLLSAKAAKRLGLVDVVVPKRQLVHAAIDYVLKKPSARRASLLERLSNATVIRPILGQVFYRQLARTIKKNHYPAPFAIVKNWMRDGARGDAMINEARSIAQLMMTPTARHLVRVFFLQERLKSLGKGHAFDPKHVHVIGAGTMGGDIAAWCALRGLSVTLQDQSAQQIAPAIKRAYHLFKQKLKVPHLIQAAMDRLQPDISGDGVRHADVVIEAIFEDLAVKQTLFKKIVPLLKPNALLATNTSSIPLAKIATVLDEPAQLVGIHFFNPVALMPLVEVIHGQDTAKTAMDAAACFVGKIGKLPIPVASHPGFLVNRILMPYLMEAMELMNEGVSIHAIDQAAVDFGMPMGPIALADKVGLDVCLSVAKNLTSDLGGVVPVCLQHIVEAGRLGVKSGRGFYRYQNGQPLFEDHKQSVPKDTVDRLILRMVNEALLCLSDKIVEDADLLDAGMVFGTGFSPFRGGVLQYAADRGYQDIYATLLTLQQQYGDRFKPADSPLWPSGSAN